MSVVLPPPPMLPSVMQVRAHRQESADTFTLILTAPEGGFHFQPGQFNMVYVFGVGEAAISLCGDPHDKSSLSHTIRAVGSVTTALADLRHGDALGVRGPFGSSWPVSEAEGQDVVLVAGGIGLPPLRPAIYEILKHRANFRRVILLYGARTPGDLLYLDEIDSWRRRGDFEIHLTVDQGAPDWLGSVGLVTSLFPRLELYPGRTLGMVCGPEVMMRFVQREFEKRGIADDALYLSLERNMQCAVGFCGHCQFGPEFLCISGPVFRYDRIKPYFTVREA
ncbi:MAG: FAD/NAD(P)-binding protein [Gemmataceae bacterium]